MTLSRPRLLVAAALAAAAAAPAPAHAAWTEPARIGPAAPGLIAPALTFAADGRGVLTGSLGLGSVSLTTPLPGTRVATLAPGAATADVVAETPDAVGPVATYARSRTIALRRRFVRRDENFDPEVRLSATFATAASPLAGTALPLDGYVDAGTLELAVSARGDAAALWTESVDGDRGDVVRTRIAVRRAGGRFGAPRTIRTQVVNGLGDVGRAVAVTPQGRAIVALLREGRGADGRPRRELRVATLRTDGRLGRSQLVGPQLGGAEVRLAVAPTGRAVLAWATQDTGEEANLPLEVWTATRAPGASRFGRARQLEGRGASLRPAGFALAVAPDGAAVVAWAAALGRPPVPYPVEVSAASPTGSFGAPQVLAPDGIVGDAAIAPDGRALVVHTTIERGNEQDGVQALAALRPSATAPFGPSEPVSPPERAEHPVAAFDPSTGEPVVAWSGSPGSPPGVDADGRTGPRSLSLARRRP